MIASHREEKKSATKGLKQAENQPVGSFGIENVERQHSQLSNPLLNGNLGTERPMLATSQTRDAPFASMWSAVKNDIRNNDNLHARKASSSLPSFLMQGPTSRLTNPQSVSARPFNLGNLETITLQKGNLQDMSEQQRRILLQLESGFKGTVEELMDSVK